MGVPARLPQRIRPDGDSGDRRPVSQTCCATAALVVTALVFAFLWARMEPGAQDTVAVMPFMDDAGTYWMYVLSRAFGWSGLLWARGTVVLGLLLSGPRSARLPVSRPVLERWHRTTSLTTMALMCAHALMVAAELVRYETKVDWAERLGGPRGDGLTAPCRVVCTAPLLRLPRRDRRRPRGPDRRTRAAAPGDDFFAATVSGRHWTVVRSRRCGRWGRGRRWRAPRSRRTRNPPGPPWRRRRRWRGR